MAPNATPSTPATPAAPADPKAGAAPVVDPKAAPAKPAEPTREVKVNGKIYNLTDAQLVALAQKGMFADGKLKSVDVLQKTTSALIGKLKTPAGILEVLKDKSLGNSPKEVLRALLKSDVIDDELKEDIAQWTYQNVVQTAKLTPEQLADRQKLSEYEQLKKADEDRKAKDANAAKQAQLSQITHAIRAEVSKQVKDDKTFPMVEGSVRAILDKLRVMNRKGVQVTAANVTKAIDLVKKDYVLHHQAIFDAITDDEALIERFGEARALRISRALIARLKAKGAKPAAKAAENGKDDTLHERNQKRFGKERHGYTVMDV